MFNKNLFTVRNLLVIVAFAIAWQVIFSRVTAFLHKNDSADAQSQATA